MSEKCSICGDRLQDEDGQCCGDNKGQYFYCCIDGHEEAVDMLIAKDVEIDALRSQLAAAQAEIAQSKDDDEQAFQIFVDMTRRLISTEISLAEAKGLLKELEWHDFDVEKSEFYGPMHCPICESQEGDKHKPDCRLAAVIAGVE